MKKTMLFLAMGLLFSLVGMSQVEVGSDKSFSAHIRDYKTYAWSNQIDKIPHDAIFVGPNGVLVFNNESTRSKIKDAIKFEMDAKGYKLQNQNPDMVIIYRVMEQPTTLTTFNGYKMYDGGFDSTRTPQNVEKTKVAAGTLIVNIVDGKSGTIAWQGYASGILKPDMVNDQAKIRQAVGTIFNRFKYMAKK